MSDPDLFDWLRRYPHAPAARNSDTSREAAADIAPKLGRLQALALEAIASAGGDGLTADELADALGVERWTVQPRTTELRRLGKVVDSGLRRFNKTGKRAICWCLPRYREANP